MTRRRLALVVILGLPAAGALAAWVWYAACTFNQVDEAVNVPRVDWLPESARDVSYFRSYSFTAYEFDIDEAGFLAWAKDEGWPVKPIGDTALTIPRHSFDKARRLYPQDDNLSPEEWRDQFARAEAARTKVIRRGYHYERRQSNGGGVTVGYDLESGRAYYQSSPR
jgi:hypothetical protein